MIQDYDTKHMTLRIKKPIGGFSVGDNVDIQCNRKGKPLEQYWRDRIEDSKIDGCVEIKNAINKK